MLQYVVEMQHIILRQEIEEAAGTELRRVKMLHMMKRERFRIMENVTEEPSLRHMEEGAANEVC